MKMPKEMWVQIIFSQDEKEEENKCQNYVINFLSKLGIEDFGTYRDDSIAYDIAWEMADKLENLDLEKNSLAKDEFFKCYKEIDYGDKSRLFKNTDVNIFTKDIKKYFAKNMISYPDFSSLYFFRKHLSQEELRLGLNNFFDQTKFNKMTNQRNEDYWENVEGLTSKGRKQLLDLLEVSNMSKTDLEKWSRIGFINDYNQLRFDKLLKLQKESEEVFAKAESETLYSIKVSLDKMVLSSEKGTTGKLNDDVFDFIKTVFIVSSGLEQWESLNKRNQEIFLITNDINKLELAKKKIDILKYNVLEYFDYIVGEVKEIKANFLIPMEVREKARKVGDKILLKGNLEEELSTLNKKTNKMKV